MKEDVNIFDDPVSARAGSLPVFAYCHHLMYSSTALPTLLWPSPATLDFFSDCNLPQL